MQSCLSTPPPPPRPSPPHTLQVLPELLFFLILLTPGLMPRAGLAGRYAEWAPAAVKAAAARPAESSGEEQQQPVEFFERPVNRALFFLSFKQRVGAGPTPGSGSHSGKGGSSSVLEGDEEAGLSGPGGVTGSHDGSSLGSRKA